jgi:glycerol-3-phosphate dehydrogenase (NAD(P)+)
VSDTIRITVLGAGSWGATLASILAEKGRNVCVWEFDPAAAQSLQNTRRLSILPELRLAASITVHSDISKALQGASMIVSAVPSHVVRSTMKAVQASRALDTHASVLSVSKGLEADTFKRMSDVIREELSLPADRIGVLGGPSHAEEVCKHLPTAVVVASASAPLVADVQKLFSTDALRVYGHGDMLGVELGAALKNVFAIACGISDGLGFGDNARAAIMTRGLNEMVRIGVTLGAEMLTFFGLAGMGDLVVTCMSRHSRNHQLGEKIGRGKSVADALKEMTMVAEGYKTAPSVDALAQRLKLECPLAHEIYEVLYRGKDPRASLHDLMGREPHAEWQGLTLPSERGNS